MKIEIEVDNEVSVVEARYRDKMDATAKWTPVGVLNRIGLETLCDLYVNYMMPRAVGSLADGENPPAKVERDWTENGKDELPIYRSGTRSSKPTKEDREKAALLWGRSPEEIAEKLKGLKKWADHELTYEGLNNGESDPEEEIAKLARKVRLAILAEQKRKEQSAF